MSVNMELAGGEKLVQELVKDPNNQLCADCGAKGPKWASYNLGVFLCIRCGGLHRRIGTHITRIKSITLDKWTPEQAQFMKDWGNVKANKHFNPHPQFFPLPTQDSEAYVRVHGELILDDICDDREMEQFIRDKYERKAMMDPITSKSKFKVQTVAGDTQSLFAQPLQQLQQLGFSNTVQNLYTLQTANGDVQEAVRILTKNGGDSTVPKRQGTTSGGAAGAQVTPSPTRGGLISTGKHQEHLATLQSMGFTNEAANKKALEQAAFRLEGAIELLLAATEAADGTVNKETVQQVRVRSLATDVNESRVSESVQATVTRSQTSNAVLEQQQARPSGAVRAKTDIQQSTAAEKQATLAPAKSGIDLLGLDFGQGSVQMSTKPQASQQQQQQQQQQSQSHNLLADLNGAYSTDPATKMQTAKSAILSMYASPGLQTNPAPVYQQPQQFQQPFQFPQQTQFVGQPFQQQQQFQQHQQVQQMNPFGNFGSQPQLYNQAAGQAGMQAYATTTTSNSNPRADSFGNLAMQPRAGSHQIVAGGTMGSNPNMYAQQQQQQQMGQQLRNSNPFLAQPQLQLQQQQQQNPFF